LAFAGDKNGDKDKPVVIESDKLGGKRIFFQKKDAGEAGANIVIEAVVAEEEDETGKKQKHGSRTITRHANGRLVVIDGDGKKIEIKIEGNGSDFSWLLNNAHGGLNAMEIPQMMRSAIADMTPSRFMIGVHCEPVTDLLKLHLGLDDNVGLAVLQVVDDSAADKAGLAMSDIITRLGETNIGSISDLIAAVEKVETNEAELHYIRRGKRETTTVTPSERQEIEKQFSIDLKLSTGDGDAEVDLKMLKKGFVNIAPGLRMKAGSQISKALEEAMKASTQAKQYALERAKKAQDMQRNNKSLEGKVEKLSRLVEKMQADLQRLVEQSGSPQTDDRK
jgi:hypothetical protein